MRVALRPEDVEPARPLDDAVTAAEKSAGQHAETSERLGRAAAFAEAARASAARVKALEDERDELAGKQSELGRQYRLRRGKVGRRARHRQKLTIDLDIVAVTALVAACVVIELVAHKGPRSQFLFALLDYMVSDESPLEVPPLPMNADKALRHRAA